MEADETRGFRPSTYGEAFAEVYDDWYADHFDTAAAVERLAELAAGGPVLELGVGTGRLAIPVSQRGLTVWGVDASPKMLERLRAKPHGAAVNAVHGDFSSTLPDGPFSLVYAAYNTFFNLPHQDQATCLEHVVTRLAPGGVLVLEAFVPNTSAGQNPGGVEVRSLDADRVVLSAHVTEPEARRARGQFIELSETGIKLRPWSVHYRTLDDLDALCLAHGLALVERAEDWSGSAFTDRSVQHVSLYRAIEATTH